VVFAKLVKSDYDRAILDDEARKLKVKLDVLRTHPLFADLSPSEMKEKALLMTEAFYKKGKRAIKLGKDAERAMLVVSGKFSLKYDAKLAKQPDKKYRLEGWPVLTKESLAEEVTPGMTMGGEDCLHHRPHTFTAKATEDSVVLK
jgi:CRP-like cAMP-binding protein